MPSSSRLRLPALAAAAALSLGGLVALGPTAPAAAAAPEPSCDATSCTVSFGYTGALESFTVPPLVSELDVRVSGASGGDARQGFSSPGGQGGTTRASLPTTPGTTWEILVGGAGSPGDAGGNRAFGGGGATSGDSYLGSGGGGSFLFGTDGTPAVVAGGGGGAGGAGEGPVPGGAGGGAGLSGGHGSTYYFYNPSTAAGGGSLTAGGAGGTNNTGSNGLAGAGPSAGFAAGAGGDSGRWPYGGQYNGGGGGGGYYGGGGGAMADSGAGGSGYAAPGVSVLDATVGGRVGNGLVTISWELAPQSVTFTSDPGSPRVGQTYQVAATGGDSGNPVTFTTTTPEVCTVSGSTVSTLRAGTCAVRADQAGTRSYQPGAAEQDVPVGRGDSAVSITSTSPDAVVEGPTYEVAVSTGPSSGAVSLSTSDTEICAVWGSTVSFVNVGQCTVTAEQAADANYAAGSDSQTFAVGKGSQVITFTSQPPQGAHPGDSFDVLATAGSLGTVTFGSATPAVCATDGATVTLLAAGTCTITADQSGDDRFDAAPTVQQDTAVTRVDSAVVLTLPASTPVAGQPLHVPATATAGGDDAAGSVQFTVDGDDWGEPVGLVAGKADSPTIDVPAGEYELGATYLPAETARVAGSTTSTTLVVQQAATVTVLTTDGQRLRAEVTSSAPSQGTPSGDVTFRVNGELVGTTTLVQGVAELAHPLANGSDLALSAQYIGSEDFLASSDSTSRHDPLITVTLSSATAPSTTGWYRTPVTLTYRCVAAGAELVAPCPQPLTVSEDGAARAVNATISAVDGGIATVSTVVSLDRTAPTVTVRGVRHRGRYLGVVPRHTCQATDGLSGVASCTITATRGPRGPHVLTATAEDRAGNVATGRVVYRLTRQKILGATWDEGAWQVRRGRTYTLAAVAETRPRFARAVPGTDPPRRLGAWFERSGKVAGLTRWTHRVPMTMPVGRTRAWTIGVKDGRAVHPVRVRLIG